MMDRFIDYFGYLCVIAFAVMIIGVMVAVVPEVVIFFGILAIIAYVLAAQKEKTK
jgi:hypothetical protein